MPIVGIILLWFGENNRKRIQKIGLIVTQINLQHTQIILHLYDPNVSNFQFQLKLGETKIGGIDGISIWLILLVNLIIPIVILNSWKVQGKKDDNSLKIFIIQVLFVNFWSNAVFFVLDLLLFYISFEAVQVPKYYKIGYYGSRNKRIEDAQNKFFIYTQIGSLFLLLAIITIYIETGTTDYQILLTLPIASNSFQIWLWVGFFIAFAVKTPMWPVHIWLPVAHGESSTGASVILAAILLKLGKKLPKMDKCQFKGFSAKQKWGRHRIGPHDQVIEDLIIGCLLGYGDKEYTETSNSARLSYKKGNEEISRSYAMWFNKFLYVRGYVAHKNPNWSTDKTGYASCQIRTSKFTSLVWYRERFYLNNIKIIPLNIKDFLTPFALAIWIKDDGMQMQMHMCSTCICRCMPGLKLSTQEFTHEDYVILQTAQFERYDLKVTINKAGVENQYYLYIWKESKPTLRKIVKPFILPEKKYKLG